MSGPAVVPGDLEASVLFQAIAGADGVEPMPPKGKLSGAVVLRAIPSHVDATRIRSSAAAAIRTDAPTRRAGG
jgi:hypothetical protein